ncbi:MAG TPA: N-6 DNA methylase [Longimicrobium sp.]|nr:N-6 DNA methylase [Longimicrobium sp.]
MSGPERTGVEQIEAVLERIASHARNPTHLGGLQEWVPALLLLAWCRDNLPREDGAASPAAPFEGWRLPEDWPDLWDTGPDPEDVLSRAFRALEAANPPLRGVFSALGLDRPRLNAASPTWRGTLVGAMRMLADMDLAADRLELPDAAGRALHAFLLRVAGEWKSGMGSFVTPPALVQLLVQLADPQPGMAVGDPACGSGGLLIEAARHVAARQERRLGVDPVDVTLQGQDVHPGAWATARVLATLHGLPGMELALGNVLTEPAFTSSLGLPLYHRVVSVPPFSLGNWGAESARDDPYRRFEHVPPRNAGDYAFVQHALATLARGGMAVLLLPSSALFRSTEMLIRASLVIDRNVLDAVIALPPNLLFGVAIAPAVLVLRAERPEGRGVLLMDASELVTPARPRNLLAPEHVARIVAAYRAFADEEGVARVVSADELEDTSFDLRPGRYVRTAETFTRRPVAELLADVCRAEAERDAAAAEIDALISDLRGAIGESADG